MVCRGWRRGGGVVARGGWGGVVWCGVLVCGVCVCVRARAPLLTSGVVVATQPAAGAPCQIIPRRAVPCRAAPRHYNPPQPVPIDSIPCHAILPAAQCWQPSTSKPASSWPCPSRFRRTEERRVARCTQLFVGLAAVCAAVAAERPGSAFAQLGSVSYRFVR